MKTATITADGQYKRLVEPIFNVSYETTEILDNLVPNEETALRLKGYIIEILLRLREHDKSQGFGGNDVDILFYHLNDLIDQVLLDKGLKTIDA